MQLELLEVSIVGGDQRVDLASDGAAVAAEAGHLDTEIDGLAGQRFKPPARLIDREEMQLRPRNIDGKHEIDGATADWHAVAHIDELHLRGGNLLQRRAIQAEDFEAGGPAGTQHEAALRVRRMHPDRDVACGILQTGDALQTGCNRNGEQRFRRPPPPRRSTAEATGSRSFGTSGGSLGRTAVQGVWNLNSKHLCP